MSFVVDGSHFTIDVNNPLWTDAVSFYRKKDFDSLIRLANTKKYVEKYSSGHVKIYDDFVTYRGEKLDNYLASRILEFIADGLDIENLAKFLNNLLTNPYKNIQEKLYKFLENNNLAITDDGHFLAFKLVQEDGSPQYHKGTIYGEDGKPVDNYFSTTIFTYPVDRIVKDIDANSCSTEGIYVGNKTYWDSLFNDNGDYTGTGVMLIVKINPRDVVSVPHADSTKLVVSRMEVIDQYKNIKKAVVKKATTIKHIKRTSKAAKSGKPLRDSKGRFIKKK